MSRSWVRRQRATSTTVRFASRWPAELAVGSEKRGLSPHLSESCDFMVWIPMAGRSDSINAAVASGLLLYELAHQRR